MALGSLQVLEHPPQWLGSVRMLVSQPFVESPSQLASPSAQVGVHRPLAQLPLMQSPGITHFWSAAHLGQVDPPQSTSLSLAFLTRSSQAGAGQIDARQTPSLQSAASAHPLPTSHGLHSPPQSTSVSVPFFTLSVQLAFWQTSARHGSGALSPASVSENVYSGKVHDAIGHPARTTQVRTTHVAQLPTRRAIPRPVRAARDRLRLPIGGRAYHQVFSLRRRDVDFARINRVFRRGEATCDTWLHARSLDELGDSSEVFGGRKYESDREGRRGRAGC